MAYTDASVFPQAGNIIPVPCQFSDISGNLVTGWTSTTNSATCYFNGTLAGTATPTESPANSGFGIINVPAAYVPSSGILQVKATIGNTNALIFAKAVIISPAFPTTTPASKPTDFFSMLWWIFSYFFGKGIFNNQGGNATLYIPNENQPNPQVLTTWLASPNEINVLRNESIP